MTTSYGTSEELVDISGFSDAMKDFNSDIMSGYDYEGIIDGIKEGKFEFDYKKILVNK